MTHVNAKDESKCPISLKKNYGKELRLYHSRSNSNRQKKGFQASSRTAVRIYKNNSHYLLEITFVILIVAYILLPFANSGATVPYWVDVNVKPTSIVAALLPVLLKKQAGKVYS